MATIDPCAPQKTVEPSFCTK